MKLNTSRLPEDLFAGANELAAHLDITLKNDGIAVCAKMPTISNWIVFTLDIGYVQRKVRLYLPEQVIIYLHLHFQRLLWLLCLQR